jgi:hypothetical protein
MFAAASIQPDGSQKRDSSKLGPTSKVVNDNPAASVESAEAEIEKDGVRAAVEGADAAGRKKAVGRTPRNDRRRRSMTSMSSTSAKSAAIWPLPI